jgi:hypothetical protein
VARKTVYLDDLEEGEIPADAGTVHFSLEGQEYEIDLCETNAIKLRGSLAPFIAAARRPVTATRKRSPSTHSAVASEQLTAIREWARRNGHEVADKGRIPADVMIAFEQAQGALPQKRQRKTSEDPEFSSA